VPLLTVTVGDKTERCPKLKVIDVSATLGEVSASFVREMESN
jgi:hypothetical protein